MKNRRAAGLLNPMRDKQIKARTRGEEGTTLVTTACPEAGKYVRRSVWKKKRRTKKLLLLCDIFCSAFYRHEARNSILRSDFHNDKRGVEFATRPPKLTASKLGTR